MTTSTEADVVDLCRGRAQLWEPGVAYEAECFAVPVTFVVPAEGWRARAPAEDWAFVSWVDLHDRDNQVNVAFAALPARGTVGERIDSILQTEGISLSA